MVDLDEDEDVNCAAWAEPHIPTYALSRIPLDREGLASAAADIAREQPSIRRDVLASPDTDSRLLPLLRRAIAEQERIAS